MFEPIEAVSPVLGMRIKDCDDLAPAGFTDNELITTINDLSATRHDYDMLLESATFEEVDEYWNPGREEVPDHYVLEAIVVDKFSRTDHRMAAVVRVLNKYLGDSEITALDPVVGKPKKTGSYAYVTVQLPFSDGQVISVIFHSPEGDRKKIGPSDQIIAFRWLLNKRDITAVVAPEEGAEVSLETIAKRLTQLVVKNTKRFTATQKQAQAERQELETLKDQVKEAENRQRELIEAVEKTQKDAASIEAELSNTLALLQKQKTINAELQAKLDALKRAKGNGKGTGAGNTSGTGKTGSTGTGTTGTGGTNENGGKPAKVFKKLKYTDDAWGEITYTISNVTPNGSDTRNEYYISRSSFHPTTGTLTLNLCENGEWAPWKSDTWKKPLRWTPDMSEAERFVEFDAKQHGYTKANGDNSGTGNAGTSNPGSGANPAAAGNPNGNTGTTTDLTELRAKLQTWRNTLTEMEKGVMSPQHILGYRGSKKEARRVANAEIQELEEKIAELEKEMSVRGEKNENVLASVGEVPSGVIKGATNKEAIKAAQEWVKKNVTKPANTVIGEVIVNSSTIKDSLGHSLYQEKLDTVPVIVPILEKGAYLGTLPDKDGKAIDNHYFAAKVNIGGTEKVVFARVKKSQGTDNRFYLHEIYTEDEIKKVAEPSGVGTQTQPFPGSATFYKKLIADYLMGVNTESANAADPSAYSGADQPQSSGRTPASGQTRDAESGDEQVAPAPAFVNTLNEVLSGKYDADWQKIGPMLDDAYAEAEQAGLAMQYDALFNQAADHLTEVMKKSREGK